LRQSTILSSRARTWARYITRALVACQFFAAISLPDRPDNSKQPCKELSNLADFSI
jgi:hypothetical protein